MISQRRQTKPPNLYICNLVCIVFAIFYTHGDFMTEWNKDMKKAPDFEPILVKVYNGLCSGGWSWHKAIRIGDKFFNDETKQVIDDPHSWAEVK